MEGRMRVTNYDYLGEQDGFHRFQPQETQYALPGEADFRIPPAEHHVLENDQDEPSITIHVFGGILKECGIFEPVAGGYVMRQKTMAVTEE